jgi:putative flavoprotein involved in K+ transport
VKTTDTLIIGAGQAGLALSRCLTDRGADHVILERGRVAQRWTERWDSLRLLTPNWMSRLPGWSYRGDDPDGFMKRDDVVGYLQTYARSFDAPVEENTEVLLAERWGQGWRVVTTRGTWLAGHLVIATGHCAQANVPAIARDLPADIFQITTFDYRNPAQIPPGGVLLVGASASGVQLADEIHRAGHEVIVAVGRHNRLPRDYRGRDILDWLDRIGTFDRPLSEMPEPDEARHEPSLQLVGRKRTESVDLGVLARRGIRLAGRLIGFSDGTARFAGDLQETTARAGEQMQRILGRIDGYIAAHGLQASHPEADPIPPVPAEGAPLDLPLAASDVRTVLWATGYKGSYPWLQADVLDAKGEIIQSRGRTPAPGLYVIGLPFMIRRNSSFIDGVGRDAEEIAQQIAPRAQREAA